MSLRDPNYEYKTFTTLDGKAHDIPTVRKTGGYRAVKELFFVEPQESPTFGVRWTDGTEEIVEDTESNRRVYAAMIEHHRDTMEKLFK